MIVMVCMLCISFLLGLSFDPLVDILVGYYKGISFQNMYRCLCTWKNIHHEIDTLNIQTSFSDVKDTKGDSSDTVSDSSSKRRRRILTIMCVGLTTVFLGMFMNAREVLAIGQATQVIQATNDYMAQVALALHSIHTTTAQGIHMAHATNDPNLAHTLNSLALNAVQVVTSHPTNGPITSHEIVTNAIRLAANKMMHVGTASEAARVANAATVFGVTP